MSAATPSPSLIANLRAELARTSPFAQMSAAHVDALLAAASEAYYAPDEVLLAPEHGPVQRLVLVRSGAVTGRREGQDAFEYEAGDLFPVGAALAERPVTATYTAQGDVFCLLIPVAKVRELSERSAPFADFLNRRVWQFLDDSRRALQVAFTSRTLAEGSLEAPLGTLPPRPPVALPPDAPVGDALQLMHDRHIGSVLVVDAAGVARGILTRHDVLGRIALPQLPLATPLSAVMTAPVQTLTVQHSAHDAAILMSRHGMRHVPITEDGRVVSIVSERDLFTLQRLSLKQVSSAIRGARDVAAMASVATDIRRFAQNLLAQGLNARALTELISHLNDVLCAQLVQLVAAEQGVDLDRMCWLAFGSEGRGEQTIATDQDNGLVFVSDDADADRPRWIAFARRVNEALDACGYPLCKGNVMASNPECCLTADEWAARFTHWIDHGAPEDLLKASIYFDLRAVAGREELAAPLRELVRTRAAAVPRFLKQLADNALRNGPPLNWLGGVDVQTIDGRGMVDLKLHGTAIFVDAARLFALAQGVPAHGTRARFLAAGEKMKVAPQESEAWAAAFEYLQMLRLQVQMQRGPAPAPVDANPNLIELATLNQVDRRVFKEALRVARQLQQRLELDYQR
jgi:CBS domain-containing protein